MKVDVDVEMDVDVEVEERDLGRKLVLLVLLLLLVVVSYMLLTQYEQELWSVRGSDFAQPIGVATKILTKNV